MIEKIFPIFLILILFSLIFRIYAQRHEEQFILILVNPKVHSSAERQIFKKFNNRPNFHVLLKNVSNKPQKVWQEWCSWGHENLYFELEINNEKILIKKSPISWTKNYPDYLTIDPGEYAVFDVYFTTEEWESLPKVRDKTPAKIKAIYEIKKEYIPFSDKKEEPTDEFDVWTGRIESQSLDVFMYP